MGAGERGDGRARQGGRKQDVRHDQPRVGPQGDHRRQHERRDRQPGVGGIEPAQAGTARHHGGGTQEAGHHDHGVEPTRVTDDGDVDDDAHGDGEEEDPAGGVSGHA